MLYSSVPGLYWLYHVCSVPVSHDNGLVMFGSFLRPVDFLFEGLPEVQKLLL